MPGKPGFYYSFLARAKKQGSLRDAEALRGIKEILFWASDKGPVLLGTTRGGRYFLASTLVAVIIFFPSFSDTVPVTLPSLALEQ